MEIELSKSHWRFVVLILVMVQAVLVPTGRAVEVRFQETTQTVVQGGSAAVQVEIVLDPGETLFSYGVRLVVGGSGGVGVTGVTVPAELNFTGFAPGATQDLDPGVMGVKGNTQFTGGEFQSYSGTMLATFTLEGLAPGVVDLGLELYRTVGSSEDVFVTKDGSVLDDSITFGAATLTVSAAPTLEVTRSDAGTVRVRYEMVAGLRYFLRRSEDLIAWEVVAETVGGAASSTTLEFTPIGTKSVFFRLEAVPNGD